MNLLYVWNDDYYRINKNKGFLLTSKYNVDFDNSAKKLTITENREYIPEFFGKNILDVIAIVGQNGSGKTMLANCIMDIIQALEGWNKYGLHFLAVFEDESKKKIDIYVSSKYENIKVDCKVCSIDIKMDQSYREFRKYKMAYFTNALSMNDYACKRYGYVYDASVGGLIRDSYSEKIEMHYIDKNKNVILNYFETEIEKMINFLYSDIDKIDIPFHLPQQLTIKINDYNVNEKYITDQLVKIREKNKGLQEVIGMSEISFSKYTDYIFRFFGNNWISLLVVNLLLNIFKELCIPQTSAENKDKKIKGFYQVLECFDKQEKETENNIFDWINQIMNNIADTIDNKGECISNYKQVVDLIKENKTIFTSKKEKISLRIKDNEKLITKLLRYYNKTNFSYPYLTFDFGLSTGEFNFLNIFANIHKALSTNNNTVMGDEKCTNVLLYFDEADLSLHPKWQQKYVDWITRFASSCVDKCKLQIMIATHSPIMLSDIPKDNVLYLQDNKITSHLNLEKNIRTFGNNIHTLFLNSFFLKDEGTMGTFAEKKINHILNLLCSDENICDDDEVILKTINFVGDELIRNKLLEMYEKKQRKSVFSKKSDLVVDVSTIDDTINALKKQVNILQNTIDQLEKMRND